MASGRCGGRFSVSSCGAGCGPARACGCASQTALTRIHLADINADTGRHGSRQYGALDGALDAARLSDWSQGRFSTAHRADTRGEFFFLRATKRRFHPDVLEAGGQCRQARGGGDADQLARAGAPRENFSRNHPGPARTDRPAPTGRTRDQRGRNVCATDSFRLANLLCPAHRAGASAKRRNS